MRLGKPFGAPESYSSCPVCNMEFRKCQHDWATADKVYLQRQRSKVLSGKVSNDIAKVVKVDNINLFLWHDGRVTWSDE
jgi:hypothetical protein